MLLSISMLDFLRRCNFYTRMQDTIFILSKPDLINDDAELNRLISFIASKAARVFRIKSPFVVSLPAIGIYITQSLRELQAKSLAEIYDFLHARKSQLINHGILSLCRKLKDNLAEKLRHYMSTNFEEAVLPAS